MLQHGISTVLVLSSSGEFFYEHWCLIYYGLNSAIPLFRILWSGRELMNTASDTTDTGLCFTFTIFV